MKKQYEEQMKKFFDLSNEIRNTVYIVFPASEKATIDDLYHARILANRTEETKKFVEELLSARNMRLRLLQGSQTKT